MSEAKISIETASLCEPFLFFFERIVGISEYSGTNIIEREIL